jgi:hypothetical protein
MEIIQTTYEKELVKFKSEICRITENVFNDRQEFPPTLFALIFKDDKFMVTVLDDLAKFFVTEAGKDLASEMIAKFNKEVKPLATAFITEGWMSVYDKSESDNIIDEDGNYKKNIVRPSDDPKRKEVLNISFESYNKTAFQMWEIKRDSNNTPTLVLSNTLDWESKEKGNVRGRFSEMLSENYSEFAQQLKKFLDTVKN